MIYLIDDKKRRQEIDFGWNEKRINEFNDFLKPIYNIEELMENSNEIFKSGNTVLYHESFLDNSIFSSDALDKRRKLEEFAANNTEFNLVFFSGSKFNRGIDNNIAYLPVSILYLNLEAYMLREQKGDVNLNFLLFGNKPEIESELNDKLNTALIGIGSEPAIIPKRRNLFLRTVKGNIQNAIKDSDEKTLFNKDVSDAKFTEYIDEWLDDVKYDNIYVPLCFGSTLSDFNGLRFATHIRCTDTINQMSNVYIYGYVGIEELLEHECFNILKTKNVKLIPFKKLEFQGAALERKELLTSNELPIEIGKLKLNVPKDFDDNHAINNEWALYKWIWSLPEAFYDQAENVLNNVEHRLYFKYLKTIYPVSYSTIKKDELELNNQEGKILLIDNDYNKGWKAVFNYILTECNDVQLDTLEIDYRALTREEIIESAYNKVIDKASQEINYDIIILDFRLHASDNDETDIDLVSGLQILKKLKAINPGIQVVIFSATNKVWNLQELQAAGADGFIHKESFENSSDNDFTLESIKKMTKTLKESLQRKFLKDFYQRLDELNEVLLPRKNFKKAKDPLPKEFVDEVLKWLEMSFNILTTGLTDINKTSAFIILFSVLENLSNRVIDSDNPIRTNNWNNESVYEFEFRKERRKLNYYKEDEIGNYYNSGITLSSKNIAIPWIQKILNTLSYINSGIVNNEDLNALVKKRNDIIHANSTTGDQAEISKNDILFLNLLLYNGLKNVI